MLDSIQNVLSRIQEIKGRFEAFSGSFSDTVKKAATSSFETVLENTIKNQEIVTSANEQQFSDKINLYSKECGVDPNLVRAVMKAESDFNPKAVSPAGALGLMQLMPQTAKSLGVVNVFDPDENIKGGTTYLKQMLNEFNQNLPLALAAYNAGPEVVKKAGGIPPYMETKNYITKVLKYYGVSE